MVHEEIALEILLLSSIYWFLVQSNIAIFAGSQKYHRTSFRVNFSPETFKKIHWAF